MKSTCIAGLTAVFLASLPAAAQPVIGAKSGIVNYVEGKVYLADNLLELQPTQFPEIKENTVMRTEEGRAEILLTPGTVLRIGENTSFKMLTTRLVDTRLELLSGSATMVAMEVPKETNVTLVFNDSEVKLTKAGIYRFDAEPGRIKVFKGAVEAKTGTAVAAVSGGKTMTLGGALAVAEKFDTDMTDSLDNWTHRRDQLMAISNASAANRARRTFGTNPCAGTSNNSMIFNLGSWGYNAAYGLGTYIPCTGTVNSPFGYRYWSPIAIYRTFYAPRPVVQPSVPSGGYSGGSRGSAGGAPSAAPSSAPSRPAAPVASSPVGGGAGGRGGRGR